MPNGFRSKSVREVLRRPLKYLIESLPQFAGVFPAAAVTFMAVLLGAVLILGWMSSKKVKEVVTKDFNQQQLVLAQHTSKQLENTLNNLRRELLVLSLSPSVQYREKVSIGKRMAITYSSVREVGTLAIRYIEAGGDRTHLVDEHGYQTVHPHPDNIQYLNWAAEPGNKGEIYISKVFHTIYGGNYRSLLIEIVTPVRQVSVDETNPVATNRFAGALVFVVDASALVAKIARDVRSGQTGYAWVMDGEGTFLYHPENQFIGRNAFEARREKKPTISFARINDIQRVMMLAGKEGTSWYTSGWHRGKEGEIRKLIAYTPVRLGPQEEKLWSVAVVAPVSEVEDAIHSIQIRQILLQAVMAFAILLGGLAFIYLVTHWSRTLEKEVKNRTAELMKSERRYKSLVESAEDIIFTVDPDGNYLSINNYGEKFLKSEAGAIMGRNVAEVFPWPSGEVVLQTVREVIENKRGTQITHPVWFGEDERWLNTNLRRLIDDHGNVYAVLGISRDITDRKKMEETSYHTEKLVSMGTLAAGVAHEINNPLGIILGFTDIILEKTPPTSETYDLLKTIEKHGLRAKRVVENLLSFARYSDRKEQEEDINEIVSAVFAVVENTLYINKIALIKELSGGLPPVRVCAEELEQVFLNIITNAVASMGAGGGTLTVKTSLTDPGDVEIRLSDTGHGIKKEHRSRIFDPLFTTKKIGEGTGLGLSVSYGIIMKCGGSISFETKTAEESGETGTTFIITLPAARPA